LLVSLKRSCHFYPRGAGRLREWVGDGAAKDVEFMAKNAGGGDNYKSAVMREVRYSIALLCGKYALPTLVLDYNITLYHA
jgi:hypothetical protein